MRVNGKVVSELGAKADSRTDKIEVDGKRIFVETPLYIVLHKPRGVVSTMLDPEGRPTVRDLLAKVPARVYPIGRLDFATSGVLLATNDGEFADGLLHPRKAVPKTYVLKVTGTMSEGDLDRWRTGVQLEDGVTLPADVKFLRHEADKTWFELTIREGKNQQIRRMGDATGFRVMRLARVAFAGITSEGLRPGDWRALQREELMVLRDAYGVPKKLPPKSSQSAHGEQGDAPDRRAPRPTRPGRPSRPERTQRPTRAERPERPTRPERSAQPARPTRPARAPHPPTDRRRRPPPR